MSALLLFIAPDDRLHGWWIVRDAVVAQRGAADTPLPDELPAHVIAIAPAEAMTVHVAELGALAPQQARAAARLLVAETSISPIDTQHVAIGTPDGADRSVAVIGNGRIAAWLESLQLRGVDPDMVLAAPLILPRPADGFVRGIIGGETVLRSRSAAFADTPGLTELLVADGAIEDLDTEQLILSAIDAPELDLRQGPFAKRRRFRIDWARVRRLGWIGAGISAATVLIAIAQIVRYDASADALDAQAEQVARKAVPDAGGDAVAALQARLAARRGGGLGFTATTGALLSAVQGSPNIELSNLVFEPDGMLRATILASGAADAEALRARLRATGLTVEATPFTTEAGRIRGEFRVSGR